MALKEEPTGVRYIVTLFHSDQWNPLQMKHELKSDSTEFDAVMIAEKASKEWPKHSVMLTEWREVWQPEIMRHSLTEMIRSAFYLKGKQTKPLS